MFICIVVVQDAAWEAELKPAESFVSARQTKKSAVRKMETDWRWAKNKYERLEAWKQDHLKQFPQTIMASPSSSTTMLITLTPACDASPCSTITTSSKSSAATEDITLDEIRPGRPLKSEKHPLALMGRARPRHRPSSSIGAACVVPCVLMLSTELFTPQEPDRRRRHSRM